VLADDSEGRVRGRCVSELAEALALDTVMTTTAGAVMLEKTPGQARQESGLGKFIRTFDPDVPGYVFWLIMLVLIGFHRGVLHVR
jgi:hypothetical protein